MNSAALPGATIVGQGVDWRKAAPRSRVSGAVEINAALGRIGGDFSLFHLEQGIESAGFRTLDVTIRHAAAIGQGDVPHADPFDRLLLAQCEVETLRLLTADAVLARLPVAIGC